MNYVSRSNRLRQVIRRAVNEGDRLAAQHRCKAWMQGETFDLLEANSDRKIRFALHRFSDSQDKCFNPAVSTLARADQQ